VGDEPAPDFTEPAERPRRGGHAAGA
jgi:hypothetical protein